MKAFARNAPSKEPLKPRAEGNLWLSATKENKMGKYNEVTFGQTEACINRMGGMQNFLRFIGGEGEIVFKKMVGVLLQLVTTISVGAAKKFAVTDHFVIVTTEDAVVKIGYLGENFKKWFLPKVEKARKAAMLSCYQLLKNSLDGPIMSELGGEDKAETSLSEIYELLGRQSHGEEGVLLTNGYANIFYVRDASGVLRVVDVYWYSGHRYWCVNADEVTFPDRWDAGDQVFARKSSETESSEKDS